MTGNKTMTPEQVIEIVTKGTTEHRRGRVKCLHVNERFALVKWPGETSYRSGLMDRVSPWVDRYTAAELEKPKHPSFVSGKTVWDSSKDEDGPLTAKKLQLLIERENEL